MKRAFLTIVAVCLPGCLADRSLPDDVGERAPCVRSEDCPPSFMCPEVKAGSRAHCLPTTSPACSCAEGQALACGFIDSDANERCVE